MMFLVELALWLILPILLGLAAGLPAQLKQAVRGLCYPAANPQMSRLQFLTWLGLIGSPVMFVVSVLLGAWFHQWRWGAISILAMAGSAYAAAWCGQRIEQMVRRLQLINQRSIEVKRHE